MRPILMSVVFCLSVLANLYFIVLLVLLLRNGEAGEDSVSPSLSTVWRDGWLSTSESGLVDDGESASGLIPSAPSPGASLPPPDESSDMSDVIYKPPQAAEDVPTKSASFSSAPSLENARLAGTLSSLDALDPSYHAGHLSHLIIPFHHGQLNRVEGLLKLWTRYHPCLLQEHDWPASLCAQQGENATDVGRLMQRASQPGLYHDPGATRPRLVFYSNLDPTASPDLAAHLEQSLLTYFARLPKHIQTCFASLNAADDGALEGEAYDQPDNGFDVVFAKLTPKEDSYLTGSRLMVEKMLANDLRLPNVDYVMYMEPDCLPVRSNWLSALQRQVAWPAAPFWVKGSIFRGSNAHVGLKKNPAILYHINGNAIYRVGDPTFRTFYFESYRPASRSPAFLKAMPGRGRDAQREVSFDTSLHYYLTDPANFDVSRQVHHLFVYADFVQNHWRSPYDVVRLRKLSPNTVLVHGGHRKNDPTLDPASSP